MKKHICSLLLLFAISGLISAQDGLIIQEEEAGVCTMDGLVETDAAGYTGEGYANIDNGLDIGMSWAVTVPSAGTYTIYCRYALGGSDETSRDAEVYVNNISDTTILEFPHISSTWDVWSSTDTLEVELEAGVNSIRLSSVTEKGLPNIDYFHIMGSNDITAAECTPAYTLNVNASHDDWGSVDYGPEQVLYDEGTEITVYAESNDGYFFHSWSGEESSTDSTFTFTIAENTDLTALFYPDGTTMDEDATGYATVQHDNGTPYLLIGGALGDTVRVDNLQDLKNYLSAPEPYIVVLTDHIQGSNTEEIRIASNKTLLGEDNAHIEGMMVSIQEARNIIIRDMTFSKVVQFDELEINSGSQNVWIDHCEFFTDRDHHQDYYDGLLDIKNASRYITVSWSKFHDHEKCILISSGDQEVRDTAIRVSFHHNYFYNGGSRLPSIRFGKAHIFNNYYEDLGTAVNTRMNACVRVEKNFFQDAGTGVGMLYSPTEGAVELIDNIFENTSYSESPTCELDVPYAYEDLLVEPAELPDLIPEEAGPRIPGSQAGNPTTINNSSGYTDQHTMTVSSLQADDKIKLIIQAPEKGPSQISIVDLQGKETLLTGQYSLLAGKNMIQIDVPGIEPGMYICRLHAGNRMISEKVLIR